jgi:hypothetical protein
VAWGLVWEGPREWAGRQRVLGANKEPVKGLYLHRTRVLLGEQRRAGCVTAGGGRVRAAGKESVKGLDYTLAGSGQVAGERANLGVHSRVRWGNASVGDGCGRGGARVRAEGRQRAVGGYVQRVKSR